MEVSGMIVAVMPLRTGESARGPWKSQDYVIEFYEDNAQYSSKMMFNVFGDNVDRFNIQQGQQYTVSFNINAREYQGRYYNDLRAWRVVPFNGQQPQPAAPQYTQQPQAPIAQPQMPSNIQTPAPFSATDNQAADSGSDLPF